MKKLISSFLLAALVSTAIAQTGTDDYYTPPSAKTKFKDRVSASVTAGTGLSFSKYGNAYTTYIAPKVSYQLTNKFKLNLGIMNYTISGNTFMPLNRNEALYNVSSGSVNGNLIMIGGEYMLNKKVRISGAVMTNVNSLNKQKDPFKAATLGVEYKTSNNSSIRFETTIMQGQGNYMNSPSSGTLSPMFGNGTAFSSDPGNFWIR